MKQTVEGLPPRSGMYATVISKMDDDIYPKNSKHEVIIDRMKCGKYCLYFKHNFHKLAGKSYRVFKDAEELLSKFKGEHIPTEKKVVEA